MEGNGLWGGHGFSSGFGLAGGVTGTLEQLNKEVNDHCCCFGGRVEEIQKLSKGARV